MRVLLSFASLLTSLSMGCGFLVPVLLEECEGDFSQCDVEQNILERCIDGVLVRQECPVGTGCDNTQVECLGVGVCGDNIKAEGETCDGADLGGQDCISQGFESGTLACLSDCSALDNSGCVGASAFCGDGEIQQGEQCDGGNLNGQGCTGLSFDDGTLACNVECTFNTNNCTDCGDGVAEGSEVCDGNDFGGQTCQSQVQDFDSGQLICLSNCSAFVTSGCGNCGNGSKDGDEDCDNNDLGGEGCSTQGAESGQLQCNSNCTFRFDNCSGEVNCTDGISNDSDPDIDCDDGDCGDDPACS